MASNIAIDLGTSRTRIFISGKGILVNEPSVIAVDLRNGEVIAVGKQAHRMVGRTSSDIEVSYPLTGGVISDFSLVEGMVKFFLKRIIKSKIFMPKAIACIPSDITEVEKRASVNAIESAGIRKVFLIEAPVAAAIGSGIEIKQPRGCLIANIGAGTTNIAVVSLNGLSGSCSIKLAGQHMDEEIIKYLKKEHNILIGRKMAETVKISIGCVYPGYQKKYFRVKGRDFVSGLPKWADISSDEILKPLLSVAEKIIAEIADMLERTPPELISDICNDGITLSGGGAQISGLPQLLSEKTGLPVKLAENPANCVIRGTGESIKYIPRIKKKNYGAINPLSRE